LTLTVLNSAATKREAKHYIKKYLRNDFPDIQEDIEDATTNHQLRVSVLKLRDQWSIDPKVIDGIGWLFAKLGRLGVAPVVVIDAEEERIGVADKKEPFKYYSSATKKKAEEICGAIDKAGARSVPIYSAFELVRKGGSFGDHANLKIPHLQSLFGPLSNGIVPVVVPVAYDPATGQQKLVNATDALMTIADKVKLHPSRGTLEKVVFIDSLGGIPSTERGGRNASHVFINLEQERPFIERDLRNASFLDASSKEIHLRNLSDMDRVLRRLPSTSGGIITTPEGVLQSSKKNPIVYNILTDRPMISPSLPVSNTKTPILQTTVLRRGVSVRTFYSASGLALAEEAEKGNIDLKRLTDLINDSFRRELNLHHYMDRVDRRVAAVIIVGDYEGAAIITWEGDKKVAYLDKLAVHSSSQGSSGIADIVFTEMIDMFPDELLWRSRVTNPVNKWYFDRCKGTMRVPESHWIMFWAGNHTREATILQDYLQICQSIEPSFK
jgi:amino-acid N-acetyltransferase